MNRSAFIVAAILLASTGAHADDWPMWGGHPSRNMVAPASETNLPVTVTPGEAGDEKYDLSKAKGIRWAARLGSACYGNPTVAAGRVLVATNNDPPTDPRFQGDRGIVLCLDEKTGKLLWRLNTPKLAIGRVSDYDNIGICSSPSIDNGRVYLVTNRCEVICLDLAGLANGNDGPFTDEAQYLAGPGKPPIEPGPLDADILWVFDMRDQLGVFPHQATSSAVLVVGDRVYATTSNGTDWTDRHIPAPDAPALICLDKNTGKLLGVEKSGISSRTFKCNWSSPAMATVNGKAQLIFGADDGFCYGFDPVPQDGVLRELWRCDCNPPGRREKKYKDTNGPAGVLATPVFAENRIFVAIGHDPEDGDGAGALVCIDPTGSGDVTTTKKVWSFDTIGRSLSTVAVKDGLLYTADFQGFIYCLESATGKLLWKHDSEDRIWGSPLLADGRIYVGNAYGDLFCLAAGRQEKLLGRTTFNGALSSSPIVANGVIYITTDKYLYALDGK